MMNNTGEHRIEHFGYSYVMPSCTTHINYEIFILCYLDCFI